MADETPDDGGEAPVNLNDADWQAAINSRLSRRTDERNAQKERMARADGDNADTIRDDATANAAEAPAVEAAGPDAAEAEVPVIETPAAPAVAAKPAPAKVETPAAEDPKVTRGFDALSQREKHLDTKHKEREQAIAQREQAVQQREGDANYKAFVAARDAAASGDPLAMVELAQSIGVQDIGAVATAMYTKALRDQGVAVPPAMQSKVDALESRGLVSQQNAQIKELAAQVDEMRYERMQRDVETALHTHLDKAVTDDDAPLVRAFFAENPARVVTAMFSLAEAYRKQYGDVPKNLAVLVDAYEAALDKEIPGPMKAAIKKGAPAPAAVPAKKTTPNQPAGETRAAPALSNATAASPTRPAAPRKKTYEMTEDERRELGMRVLEELEEQAED